MNVVFYGCWSDYEEDGWIVICEKNGQYYYQEGGYCVMAESHPPEFWNPELISENEALDLMMDWAEHEDEATLEEIIASHCEK